MSSVIGQPAMRASSTAMKSSPVEDMPSSSTSHQLLESPLTTHDNELLQAGANLTALHHPSAHSSNINAVGLAALSTTDMRDRHELQVPSASTAPMIRDFGATRKEYIANNNNTTKVPLPSVAKNPSVSGLMSPSSSSNIQDSCLNMSQAGLAPRTAIPRDQYAPDSLSSASGDSDPSLQRQTEIVSVSSNPPTAPLAIAALEQFHNASDQHGILYCAAHEAGFGVDRGNGLSKALAAFDNNFKAADS